MNPEIEAKCELVVNENVWVIQIKIPSKDRAVAVGLADEFMRIAKERMEIESAKEVAP